MAIKRYIFWIGVVLGRIFLSGWLCIIVNWVIIFSYLILLVKIFIYKYNKYLNFGYIFLLKILNFFVRFKDFWKRLE